VVKATVLIEGILLLVIGFIGLAEAIRLVTDIDPHTVYDVLGPGYYILFLSLALMVTGALHIAVNYRKGSSEVKVEVDIGLRRRMMFMILGLVIYTWIINFLGYPLSTFFFFLFEFRVVGIKSWRTNIFLTIALTTAYHLVFIKYGNMVFPRGIF
jgi:hypothetical protein